MTFFQSNVTDDSDVVGLSSYILQFEFRMYVHVFDHSQILSTPNPFEVLVWNTMGCLAAEITTESPVCT